MLIATFSAKSMCQVRLSVRNPIFRCPPLSKSWFSGRGWGQQLFSFQSPAVQWMARTSSLNCLSSRNPYQTPDSLNCLPPFHWKRLFFTEKCFIASPSQKSALIKVFTFSLNGLGPPEIGWVFFWVGCLLRRAGEASQCREAKIAARQFCHSVAAQLPSPLGQLWKGEKKPTLVEERHFGRPFKRHFGWG